MSPLRLSFVVALLATVGSTAIALEACSSEGVPFKETEKLDPSDGGATNVFGQPCAPGAQNLEGCACNPGTPPRDCFDSDPELAGVGVCNFGKQECVPSQEGTAWARCLGAGHPLGRLCNGEDNLCNHHPNEGCSPCDLGETGACADAGRGGGGAGAGGSGAGGAGGDCTPGTVEVIADGTHGCTKTGSKTNVRFCESTGQWECFPADDCVPDSCKACISSNCAQELQAGGGCGSIFDDGLEFLEECGPDRSRYFADLMPKCGALLDLLECKQSACTSNGTCSFW